MAGVVFLLQENMKDKVIVTNHSVQTWIAPLVFAESRCLARSLQLVRKTCRFITQVLHYCIMNMNVMKLKSSIVYCDRPTTRRDG